MTAPSIRTIENISLSQFIYGKEEDTSRDFEIFKSSKSLDIYKELCEEIHEYLNIKVDTNRKIEILEDENQILGGIQLNDYYIIFYYYIAEYNDFYDRNIVNCKYSIVSNQTLNYCNNIPIILINSLINLTDKNEECLEENLILIDHLPELYTDFKIESIKDIRSRLVNINELLLLINFLLQNSDKNTITLPNINIYLSAEYLIPRNYRTSKSIFISSAKDQNLSPDWVDINFNSNYFEEKNTFHEYFQNFKSTIGKYYTISNKNSSFEDTILNSETLYLYFLKNYLEENKSETDIRNLIDFLENIEIKTCTQFISSQFLQSYFSKPSLSSDLYNLRDLFFKYCLENNVELLLQNYYDSKEHHRPILNIFSKYIIENTSSNNSLELKCKILKIKPKCYLDLLLFEIDNECDHYLDIYFADEFLINQFNLYVLNSLSINFLDLFNLYIHIWEYNRNLCIRLFFDLCKTLFTRINDSEKIEIDQILIFFSDFIKTLKKNNCDYTLFRCNFYIPLSIYVASYLNVNTDEKVSSYIITLSKVKTKIFTNFFSTLYKDINDIKYLVKLYSSLDYYGYDYLPTPLLFLDFVLEIFYLSKDNINLFKHGFNKNFDQSFFLRLIDNLNSYEETKKLLSSHINDIVEQIRIDSNTKRFLLSTFNSKLLRVCDKYYAETNYSSILKYSLDSYAQKIIPPSVLCSLNSLSKLDRRNINDLSYHFIFSLIIPESIHKSEFLEFLFLKLYLENTSRNILLSDSSLKVLLEEILIQSINTNEYDNFFRTVILCLNKKVNISKMSYLSLFIDQKNNEFQTENQLYIKIIKFLQTGQESDNLLDEITSYYPNYTFHCLYFYTRKSKSFPPLADKVSQVYYKNILNSYKRLNKSFVPVFNDIFLELLNISSLFSRKYIYDFVFNNNPIGYFNFDILYRNFISHFNSLTSRNQIIEVFNYIAHMSNPGKLNVDHLLIVFDQCLIDLETFNEYIYPFYSNSISQPIKRFFQISVTKQIDNINPDRQSCLKFIENQDSYSSYRNAENYTYIINLVTDRLIKNINIKRNEILNN